MRKRFVSIILSSVLITFGAMSQSPTSGSKGQAGASITAEAVRLKGILAALKLPAADNEFYNAQFSRIERANQAGHVFLSLFLLHQLAATLPAFEYQKANTDVEKAGLEALEREWCAGLTPEASPIRQVC